MSDIKVRIGQQNSVKVLSSVSGSAGGRAVVSDNVIGGIASVTALNVNGISTFSDIYATGLVGIGSLNQSTSKLWVEGDAWVSGIITASRIYSNIYGELTGGPIRGTTIVGTAISISGISTYANGPVIIGTENIPGDSSQVLQVVGDTYISGLVGIGSTIPTTDLDINGVLGFTAKNNILIGNLQTGINLTPRDPYEFSGINNIFIGNNSGGITSTGYGNVFLGNDAGSDNTSGYYNTFISFDSGSSNRTGVYNIFSGTRSGFSNVSGSNNSFYGPYSGYSNISGSSNIFLGSNNGISTQSSSKIIIGSGYFDINSNQSYHFDSPDTTKDFQLAIGIRTNTGPNNYWLVGNESFNIGIGTDNPNAKLHVHGGVIFSGETSTELVRLTQTGSGPALIVEDSENPDTTPFVVTADGKVGVGLGQEGIGPYALEVDGGDIRFVTGSEGDIIISHSNLVSTIRGESGIQLGFGVDGQNDAIRINLNKNVGIGTSVANSKLHVNGDVYASGVITASNLYVGDTSLVGSGVSINNFFVSGISTFIGDINASSASFSGNVTIGGTLTYEDVTNIDSVGLVTARTGVRILDGGLSVDSGISTFNGDIYYNSSYTNGVAYFDSSKILVSTGSTDSSVEYTNYILTTDNSGIPTWSNVLDGGTY